MTRQEKRPTTNTVAVASKEEKTNNLSEEERIERPLSAPSIIDEELPPDVPPKISLPPSNEQKESSTVATKELDTVLGGPGRTSTLPPPYHFQSRSATMTTENENYVDDVKPAANDEPVTTSGSQSHSHGHTHADGGSDKNHNHSAGPLPPKPSDSSFAQLAFRTFETYMSEAINEAKAEQFPPLQMLQQMNLCNYTGQGLNRLTLSASNVAAAQPPIRGGSRGGGGGGGGGGRSGDRPSKPIALRHIHSTPLQHTPSIMDDEDEKEPPPIGLDILSRSRSTPIVRELSLSKNSAFVRSNSQLSQDLSLSRQGSNSSAFTALAPYPMKKASSRSTETEVKPVIFNPIKLPDDVEKNDELAEMTSIEIVNVPKGGSSSSTSRSKKDESNNTNSTFKAAKRFLSDVRNLRMRPKPKMRGGRENPVQPPSVSDDSAASLSSKSSSGNSGDKKKSMNDEKKSAPSVNKNRAMTRSSTLKTGSGQQSQSSDDEQGGERSKYAALDDTESPTTVPSPVYQRLGESPDQVCVQLNNNTNINERSVVVASPDPGRVGRSGGATTPHSQDSPETALYSSTTSSSGRTTHATSTTYSSGRATSLSAISETDREVMELNNANGNAKRSSVRERDGETVDSDKTENIEVSLESGRNVRFGDYVELVDTPSPINPRDGATVQADRFFTFNNRAEKRSLARLRSLPSVKRGGSSHSPTTVSSASYNTNSSTSTMGDEPPMIVSYVDRKLDKKQVSDLTSLHRETQSSSPRSGGDDREVRESSPSDQILVENCEVVFEGAQAPKDIGTSAIGANSNKPRPIWPAKGLQFGRKIRSLPPRSPHKGLRGSATPPPRGGSPAAAALSPPRQIIDRYADPNLLSSSDKAYVLDPASSHLQAGMPSEVLSSTGNVNFTHVPLEGSGDLGSHEVVRLSPITAGIDSLSLAARNYYSMITGLPRGSSPVGHGRATYEENSIEILKSESKDEVNSAGSPLPLVTPENGSTSSC